MIGRRRFVSFSAKLATGIGILLLPGVSWVNSVYGRIKKSILPANTKMRELIRRDPGGIDTRNLKLTPLSQFGTMGNIKHKVDLNKWRLVLNVNTNKPLSFSYEEILSLPAVERSILLICPGFFAQHGRWKGIDMQKFLRSINVSANATEISFSGPVGSAKSERSFPLDLVLSNQVFLAYQVNGRALPEKHGLPLRVVAEEAYGDNWIKYVNTITIKDV